MQGGLVILVCMSRVIIVLVEPAISTLAGTTIADKWAFEQDRAGTFSSVSLDNCDVFFDLFRDRGLVFLNSFGYSLERHSFTETLLNFNSVVQRQVRMFWHIDLLAQENFSD